MCTIQMKSGTGSCFLLRLCTIILVHCTEKTISKNIMDFFTGKYNVSRVVGVVRRIEKQRSSSAET